MSDLEKMLTLSNDIERFKKERHLSAEATGALIELVETQRRDLAIKDARIRILECKLQRATPRWPINDLGANV